MALKISANTLLEKHYLVVKPDGIKYYESAFIGGMHRFKFSEIDCLLMSPEHKLSFQVGREVFSIPTQPYNPKHQAAIAELLQQIQRANGICPPAS